MKKLILALLVMVVFFSCTESTTNPSPDPTEEVITEKNILDFQNANLTFAGNIFKEIIAQSKSNENIMISPVSISIAFSMLNNGAAENTKAEIKSVLQYDEVPDFCINQLFLKLINKLDSLNSIIDLDFANGAWFDDDFVVKQDFVDENKEFFDIDVSNLDLDITASIDTINTWVSNKTDGKIEEVLSYEDIGAEFFLANAINFQGFWKFPFDPDETKNFYFNNEDSTMSQVLTMFDNGISDDAPSKKFKYLFTDTFKAVKVPYGEPDSTKNNDDVSMYVFVPYEDLKPFIETELNSENWEIWMNSFISFDEQFPDYTTEFNFTLPKFKFGYEANLIPVLQTLGIIDAFLEGVANFSEMTDNWQGLFIALVKHKSFIEVNEEGTSAAAVTIIGGYDNNIPLEFRVNKPFLFAIRDDLTGTILFIGQVYNPEYE